MPRSRRWKQITVPLRAPGTPERTPRKEPSTGVKTVWNGERTFEAYRRALEHLSGEFPANYLISDIPQILSQIHRPKLIIRHDVGGDLEKAQTMAEIERELDIRATYLINPLPPASRTGGTAAEERLAEIRAMGHEIGLNVASFPAALASYSVEQYVRAESRRLSEVLGGTPICCVSFTEPPSEQSGESLFIGNLVNASSPILMRWTLVDTDKTWTIPIPSPAERNPDRALLQLVVQPASWAAEVLT